nr:hypothetical protein [Mesorhizobium sp.]
MAPDIDAVSTVASVSVVLTTRPAFATDALGRTTELVVSLDGICKASTLDVDEQPARQSDASTKLTTLGIRIFDLYAKQNRPKAGTTPPDNQLFPNEKLPTKFESKFTFRPAPSHAIRCVRAASPA